MSKSEERKHTLAELRAARKLTREQLAVQLGASYSTIVNIELGRSKPRVELADKIYAFFEVPAGSIQWGKRSESPKIEATRAA